MATKIGSLIIDLKDKELVDEERDLLSHPLVGGVILFSRNYDSREQLIRLCQAIRKTRKEPLLIMVDQEGGRVQRFIADFTRLSPMALFGRLAERDSNRACQLAKNCGWLMATELLSAGVDMSLAPILDLNKGISGVIGDRAFHADPHQVIELADAFIKGMKEAGMAATGKHFPGHGSIAPDSHVAMPVDERSLPEIEREDLIPFVGLIKRDIPALMAAHITFPKIDKFAVGFSTIWLKTILREQLGFKGVILSDDLNMEGANISSNYAERVIASREAGCDFALLCNNRSGVIQALDHVPVKPHQVEQEKWGALSADFSRINPSYQASERWHLMREFLLNEAPTI